LRPSPDLAQRSVLGRRASTSSTCARPHAGRLPRERRPEIRSEKNCRQTFSGRFFNNLRTTQSVVDVAQRILAHQSGLLSTMTGEPVRRFSVPPVAQVLTFQILRRSKCCLSILYGNTLQRSVLRIPVAPKSRPERARPQQAGVSRWCSLPAERHRPRMERRAGGAAQAQRRAEEGELIDLIAGQLLQKGDLHHRRALLGEQVKVDRQIVP
jgi:hypothetical protein